MWSLLITLFGFLSRFIKQPSEAEKLGRTEQELASAKKALGEAINAKKIESDIDNDSPESIKLRLSKWTRHD